MRKQWIGVSLMSFALGGSAIAADHRDGPGVDMDATVDITDVYAWSGSGKVNLVMDIQGANTGATATTKFSDAALYVFHVTSGSGVGMTSMESTIICKFDNAATQGFQCWGPGGEYVTGATGNKAGVTSTSGKVKVAAIVRDDPFPFNIRGFIATATTVNAAAGALPKDQAGCPTIDSNTSQVLVAALKSNGSTGAGTDDFGKMGKAPVGCATGTCDQSAVTNGNVLSIVVQVDASLLTTNGTTLGVWASTNKVK